MNLHITWGPNVEIRREPLGLKWCFGCRKRLLHEAVLFDYPEPERYESYLGPMWAIKCSGCGNDRTRFPGW